MAGIAPPESLSWWRRAPGGSEWLDALPRLATECAEQWSLTLERPFQGAFASLVIPAGDVVLKLNPPDGESAHEPDVLAAWDGDGAVRLLARDASRRALLLERCVPGTSLLELDDDEAGDVAVSLLRRLSRPALPQLRQLTDVAARWVDELPRAWNRHGRPFERQLLDAAISALAELGPTQSPAVIANEDLHAGNVLRARREPWLLIDPKPIAAEPAFTPVAMIRDRMRDVLAGPRPLARVRRRLDRFAASLDVDRDRVRRWSLAHTVAWSFDPDRFRPDHAALARLLLEA